MILLAKAVWEFMKSIPWKVWATLLAAVILAVALRMTFVAGMDKRQAEWDASVERGKAIVEELKLQRGTVTTITETKIVERIKVVREQAKALETVREVFVPVDSGYLNGGFRLFYDAAITGTIPDPAEIPSAAPVAVTDVASTHAVNAERCRIAYETVAGWETWASEQCKLNPNGCPENGD